MRDYKRNPRIIKRYKKEIYLAIKVNKDNRPISIYNLKKEDQNTHDFVRQ